MDHDCPTGECWRPVPGYDDPVPCYGTLLRVSCRGWAHRAPVTGSTGRRLSERTWKPWAKTGYPMIPVPGRKGIAAHIAILTAFVGPRPGDKIDWHACHNDDDPNNNDLRNLRWDTMGANHADAVRNGRLVNFRGENHPRARFTDELVVAVRKLAANGVSLFDLVDATGIRRHALLAVISGTTYRYLPGAVAGADVVGRRAHTQNPTRIARPRPVRDPFPVRLRGSAR